MIDVAALKKSLYDLLESYNKYGVDSKEILDNYLTMDRDPVNGPASRQPTRSRIEDLDNWNPIIAKNKAAEIERLIRKIGDKRLNTYPGLVKNNLDVFFPDGVPEDALDDYEEDEHSVWYTPLDLVLESEVSPKDFAEGKKDIAEFILKDKREANELRKSQKVKKEDKKDEDWGGEQANDLKEWMKALQDSSNGY